jgi:hypothetical protein
MKRISSPIICAVVLLTIFSCSRDERIREKPKDIIPSTVDPAVFQKIMEQFPESKDVKESHAELFEAGASKQVVLSAESEVYVTYISEGASYSNSFGWYSYNGNAPTQPSDIEVHLLFPTVSSNILVQGDMLRLGSGKFPAGTVIGFFLVIKGWEGGEVHYDRETFYTNFELNADDQQQHILFKQKDLGNIILAFEDVLTTQASDMDFNDILFMVTDNRENKPVTNLNLTSVIEL